MPLYSPIKKKKQLCSSINNTSDYRHNVNLSNVVGSDLRVGASATAKRGICFVLCIVCETTFRTNGRLGQSPNTKTRR